jgi:hypothetical protein
MVFSTTSASTEPVVTRAKLAGAALRILESPIKTAAAFVLVGRLLYSLIAALYAPYLRLDSAFVNSNKLTYRLMSQSEGWKYSLLGVWERFDTLWYIHIAQSGYDRPDALVFYPLYPLLIMISHLPPLVAALLISTVSSFLFAWGFQKLVMLDYLPAVGGRALVLYLVWPAGFMLFAGYPESLLLCCVVWAIYFARSGSAVGTVLMALLAGATKPMGALVFVPIAFIAIRESKWRVLASSLAAACAPVAMALWLNASGRMAAQQVYATYWGTTIGPPWQTFWFALVVPTPFGGLNMLALCLVILFAFLGRLEYSFFAASVLWVVLSKQTMPLLESTSRYVMLIFPAFLNAGRVLDSRLRFALFVAALALIALSVLERFLNWRLIV